MMKRISFDDMFTTIKQAFILAGLPEDKATVCARTHTETSRDGVYSHGLNRVERFLDFVSKGWVDVHAEPSLDVNLGSIEIYNGNMGIGITNSIFAMDRAMDIAKQYGLGLVALNNTTHWMRGGSYGWQAADKGYMAICWTNTESCMPAWGATSCGIGNNPFIMSIPRKEGHVVFDMAMSQYSYGKLETTRLNHGKLPFPGGFDQDGKLTDEPAPIEATRRILPTGYWKGSGLAVMLDLFSAILSKGRTTADIDLVGKGACGGCSQVFIAIDPLKINDQAFLDEALEHTINQLRNSTPVTAGGEVNYPGERSLKTRSENMKLGIPVDEGVWKKVVAFSQAKKS